MHELVKKMLNLQELELIREEAFILHGDKHLNKLAVIEKKIVDLRIEIPPDLLKRYDLLRQTGLGAAHEKGGFCSSCRLKIPKGDLNRMKRNEEPWVCPNCGRFISLENPTAGNAVCIR